MPEMGTSFERFASLSASPLPVGAGPWYQGSRYSVAKVALLFGSPTIRVPSSSSVVDNKYLRKQSVELSPRSLLAFPRLQIRGRLNIGSQTSISDIQR